MPILPSSTTWPSASTWSREHRGERRLGGGHDVLIDVHRDDARRAELHRDGAASSGVIPPPTWKRQLVGRPRHVLPAGRLEHRHDRGRRRRARTDPVVGRHAGRLDAAARAARRGWSTAAARTAATPARRAHTATQSRPSDAVSRARLANAAAGSSKNITPKRESTTSNGASASATSARRPSTHSIGAASAVTAPCRRGRDHLGRRCRRRRRCRPARRARPPGGSSVRCRTRRRGPAHPGAGAAAANSTSDTGASWPSTASVIAIQRVARSAVQASVSPSATVNRRRADQVVDQGHDLLGAGDERLDLAAARVDDLLPRPQLDGGEVELGDALGERAVVVREVVDEALQRRRARRRAADARDVPS